MRRAALFLHGFVVRYRRVGRGISWKSPRRLHADACARDAAILASIALQYGVPLDVLRKALLRDQRGNASTPIGTALDLIAERDDR